MINVGAVPNNFSSREKGAASSSPPKTAGEMPFQMLFRQADQDQIENPRQKQPGVFEMSQAAVIAAGNLIPLVNLISVYEDTAALSSLPGKIQAGPDSGEAKNLTSITAVKEELGVPVTQGSNQHQLFIMNSQLPSLTLTGDKASMMDLPPGIELKTNPDGNMSLPLSFPQQKSKETGTEAIFGNSLKAEISTVQTKALVKENKGKLPGEMKSDPRLCTEKAGILDQQFVNKTGSIDSKIPETTTVIGQEFGKSSGEKSDAGLPEGKGTIAQDSKIISEGQPEKGIHPADGLFVSKMGFSKEGDTAAAPDPVRQISDRVTEAFKDQRFELRMKLQPEGLGNLTVKMAYEGGRLSLHIITDTVQSQNLLAHQMGDLKLALEGQEIIVDRMNVVLDDGQKSFWLDGGFRNFSHGGQERQKDGEFPMFRHAIRIKEGDQSNLSLDSPVLSTGVLNYRI